MRQAWDSSGLIRRFRIVAAISKDLAEIIGNCADQVSLKIPPPLKKGGQGGFAAPMVTIDLWKSPPPPFFKREFVRQPMSKSKKHPYLIKMGSKADT
jgi:hypothetical protein